MFISDFFSTLFRAIPEIAKNILNFLETPINLNRGIVKSTFDLLSHSENEALSNAASNTLTQLQSGNLNNMPLWYFLLVGSGIIILILLICHILKVVLDAIPIL